ncbi:hypothetical protein E1283_09435 [Streptomyces hainanensis]|uniref:Uncharacterized protein n=1 Tax=Streptomyces hainanensis TaxID=402648 RepID=A0A4R4TFX4_9ACTN|nr:hypothetical protein E1283_09435 [Streptomyces hainanensis]
MRRAIRLTLPVVAVATALVLSGCKSGGRGGSSSGGSGGSGSSSGGQHDDDDDLGFGGTTGGGSTSGGTTGGRNDNNARPSNRQLEGDWYTGVDPSAANIEIESGSVTFYEDLDVEGDVCEGTVRDGRLTLASCREFGTRTWNDRSATLALVDGVLRVSWSSGTTMEMRNARTPGSFTDAELAAIQETLNRLNAM